MCSKILSRTHHRYLCRTTRSLSHSLTRQNCTVVHTTHNTHNNNSLAPLNHYFHSSPLRPPPPFSRLQAPCSLAHSLTHSLTQHVQVLPQHELTPQPRAITQDLPSVPLRLGSSSTGLPQHPLCRGFPRSGT